MRSFAQARVIGEKPSKPQLLVPGMSQYDEDDDVESEPGTAGTGEYPSNPSISTGVALQTEVLQDFEFSEEAATQGT